MVLFNNCHGEAGADAAFAFRADCENVNGVLHGEESDGGKKGRLSGLEVFFTPPNDGGNNLVAQGLPQGRGQTVATAHADAAIFALVEGCHGGEHEHVTSFGFADEAGNHGDELVFDEGGSHGKKRVMKLAPR